MGIILLILLVVVILCFIMQNNNDKECNFKEEYKKKENELTTDVIKTLNIDKKCYSKNIEYFEKKLCPYCNESIVNKKSTSFLCPICKNKIYRKNHFINKKTLYLTEQELNLFINEKEEYNKYKKFCGLCRKINQSKLIYVNEKDIQGTIIKLHLGKKTFYQRNTFFDLRISRHCEGLIQLIYGTPQQATNAFMSVLYMDLFGNYDILDKKWDLGSVHPNAYANAFNEDLTLEKFEKIFLANANSLVKVLQFTPPIMPEEAWQKILEYRKTLN